MDVIQKNNLRENPFTLIELMIVFGIILILAAMLLPTLQRSKNTAQATYCKNNLKQLGTSNLIYSSEWERFVAWGPSELERWHGARDSADVNEPFDSEKGPLYTYMKGQSVTDCPEFAKNVDTEAPSIEGGGGGYGYNLYIGTKAYFVDGDPFSGPSAAQQNLTQEAYLNGILVKQLNNPTDTVMFTDSAMNVNNSGNIESASNSGVVAPYSITYAPFGVNGKATNTTDENDPSIHFLHDRTANVSWADGHVNSQTFKWTLNSGWKVKSLGFFGPDDDNSLFDPH